MMDTAAAQALQLRDIHLPPAPPWWPPAPGWWLLTLLVLGLLALGGWWLVRVWRQRRRRREVLTLLNELECALTLDPVPEHLAGLSALLKRLALQRHPRREVAALSGTDWLTFLDRTGGGGAFTAGPGRALGDEVYQPKPVDQVDTVGLMRAVHLWVRQNAGGNA